MNVEVQPGKLHIFERDPRSGIDLPSVYDFNGSPTSSQTSSRALPPLVIATWNIWEDDRFFEYRHPHILRKLFEDPSSLRPDVITLQEVTPKFFDLLLTHPIVRDEWILTDLTHQLDICPNPYGTVILIRKSPFVNVQGVTVAAGFHEFENTRMQRGVSFVEFSCRDCQRDSSSYRSSENTNSSRHPILRIGTSHFESHPEDKRKRREQFEISAGILTSPGSCFFDLPPEAQPDRSETTPTEFVPAILTGDCNICSYDELTPLLNPSEGAPSFIDTFLTVRPINSNTESPFTSHPTFGLTIPNRKAFGKHKLPEIRRLDYIFTHNLNVSQNHSGESGFIGGEPACEKAIAEDEEGRDGRVYASDHLGVWVRVQLSKQ